MMDIYTKWNMIRGAILAMKVDTPTKKELLEAIDAIEPECERCGGVKSPAEFVCRECGPEP